MLAPSRAWRGLPLPTAAKAPARRPLRAAITMQQRKRRPEDSPGYRRGGDDVYWRKRPEDRTSRKGNSVSNQNKERRRGRPAHLRSPDDTPLRDGNRDRLMGLLTDRAMRTLVQASQDDNPVLHSWLSLYLRQNRIPRDGNWSDVSGENFLRKLMTTPIEEISSSFGAGQAVAATASAQQQNGGAAAGAGAGLLDAGSFANASPLGGDPRQIAQRIMDLRHQIAKEWVEDLKQVSELNADLMRQAVMGSLTLEAAGAAGADGGAAAPHPELPQAKSQLDDSAGCSDH